MIPPNAEPPVEGLGRQARAAVLWSGAVQVLRDLLQFAGMLVLVRLLPPEAYGEFGLVNAIIGMIAVFGFQSFLSHTLVMRDEDGAVDYDLHYSMGVAIQGALFLVTNAVALGMTAAALHPEVAPLVHALSLWFLLEVPTDTRRRMLERQMRFRRIAAFNVAGFVAAMVVSVGLALAGVGSAALLLPPVLGAIPYIWDLHVRQRWRPTWRFDLERYRPALRFGLARIGAGGAQRLRILLESTVLIGLFGLGGFGIVGRAMGLSQMACGKVSQQLMSALFPVLGRLPKASPRFRRASGLIFVATAWIVTPAAAALALFADPAIRVLYGSKWVEAIPLMPSAMALGLVSALSVAMVTMLVAHGSSTASAAIDYLVLVGCAAVLALMGARGAAWYLWGMTLVNLAGLLVAIALLLRMDALDPRLLAAGVVGAVVSSAAGVGAGLAVARLVPGERHPLLLLLAGGGGFTAACALVLAVGFRGPLRELAQYFPSIPLRGRGRAADLELPSVARADVAE